MENSGQKLFRASPDFIHRTIAGQHVLVSIGGNIANFNGYIQLNETAAFLWDQLREPKAEQQLLAALTAEFDVPGEQAEEDMKEFLTQLMENGMVTVDG